MPAPHRLSRLGFVNAYLVEEDDGLTLVDTMIPRSGKAIRAAADALGRPIVRIALTHAHGDHVGSLDELAGALPGVEVLISGRDARLLAKEKSLDPGEPGKLRGCYPGASTRPTRTVEPGDRDRLARGRRRARAHPGPRGVPRRARPHPLLRRRLLDPRRHGDDGQAQPALPAAGPGHVAPADRARERARPARAGPGAARPRPRRGRRAARRPPWTRRSPRGPEAPAR